MYSAHGFSRGKRARSSSVTRTPAAARSAAVAVIQALLGHAHVDSSVGYIHLAPVRVRAAYDAARDRQRGRA